MNDPAPRPFWQWPDRWHVGHYLLLSLGVSVWGTLVYGGADWLTAQHTYRVRVHLDAELATPFVPASVLGYTALYYPLFWGVPFILHTGRELHALATTLCTVIGVAGICFLLLPAEPAFPPTPDCGPWEDLVCVAKQVALTYNLVPSLHVAFSVILLTVYGLYAGMLGRMILSLWAAVIAASTLLLHQHYIIDVVTGLLLGLAGVRWVYCRQAFTAPRSQAPRA
jgi:membrane-associated phospholipid phosphatase